MATLLRIIFLYIPAFYGYYVFLLITLGHFGYIDEEALYTNEEVVYSQNDYQPVYTDTQVIGDRRIDVTYNEKK